MARQHDFSDDGPALRGALEAVLQTRLLDAERMEAGEVNRVYRVETAAGRLAFKIFTYPDWPEADKPPWVEEQLTRAGVPHARMIQHSRGGEFFPHGFAVYEFVEGRNCQAALLDGSLSVAEYSRLAGALLRRVHAVRPARFGYLAGGAGTNADFVEAKLAHEVRDRLREVEDPALLDPDLSARVEERVRRMLAPLAARFAPALVHADAAPRNALLTPGRRLLLLDWDEAVSSIWVEDLTKLSYWYSYLYEHGDARQRREAVLLPFLRGHGAPDFDAEEVAATEHALHLIESADRLAYYYKTKNSKAFGRTKETLTQLLK